jgi:hypothetical protein
VQRGNYRVSSLAYEKKRQGISGIAARQRGKVKKGLRDNPLRIGVPLAAQVVDPSASCPSSELRSQQKIRSNQQPRVSSWSFFR